MNADVIIRRLGSADAEIYRRIRLRALADVPQFVGPTAEQEALSNLAELEKRMENYELEGVYAFGAFVENECAGISAMSRKLNTKYSHKIFFWGLYILPEYRGRSIGRQLMEHRIAFARSLPGVRFAMLQVVTTNEAARAMHKPFGFVSCGIEPCAKHIDGKFYDFEMMQVELSWPAQVIKTK